MDVAVRNVVIRVHTQRLIETIALSYGMNFARSVKECHDRNGALQMAMLPVTNLRIATRLFSLDESFVRLKQTPRVISIKTILRC